MPSLCRHPFQSAVSYLSIGLLVSSSLAFGQSSSNQNSAPPSPPDQQQQTANPSGGWKRVGDAPAPDQSNPAYPNYSANQSPAYGQGQSGDSQAPPPPPPAGPQSGAQSNAPVYQQPNYYRQQPNYPQQPNYQQPYSGNQQGYVQQPNAPAPPPVPAHVNIPAGTFITARVNQVLSSDRNQAGDAFSATLVQPVVAEGVVVAEPGQTLGGRVVLAEKHGVGQSAKLGVQLTSMTLVDGTPANINTELTSRSGSTTPGGVEAGTIVATTGLGAAIGAAAGWGTGAAIGAGAGALAGIIGVVVTHNHASVIYPEQILTFRLETPVTVFTQTSPQAFRYITPGEYDQPPQYASGPGPYQQYATAPPPAAPYYYGYPHPYWGSPYYWGPGFAFYWGPGFYYGRGYYGAYRGYYGYRGGFYGGHGYVAGGVSHVGGGAAVHGGGGGHR